MHHKHLQVKTRLNSDRLNRKLVISFTLMVLAIIIHDLLQPDISREVFWVGIISSICLIIFCILYFIFWFSEKILLTLLLYSVAIIIYSAMFFRTNSEYNAEHLLRYMFFFSTGTILSGILIGRRHILIIGFISLVFLITFYIYLDNEYLNHNIISILLYHIFLTFVCYSIILKLNQVYYKQDQTITQLEAVQKQQAELNEEIVAKNDAILLAQEKLDEQNKVLVSKNRQLEQREAELREANETKDKFFTIIAHDLKNPASTLLGFSELLYKNIQNLNDQKKNDYSKHIYQASQNLYNLLQNLLLWSRSQTNGITTNFTKIPITKIVNECNILLQSSAKAKNITINTAIQEDLYAYADYNMIFTVLNNLISNAIKFTHRDGEINITGKNVNKKTIVQIQDTGVGMEEEMIDTLFTIKNKNSDIGTNGETGTGLGLIIVKEFLEKNNGSISVESAINKGSTFTLVLNSI